MVVCLWPVVSVLGPVDNKQSRLCLLALIWLQGNEEAINLQAVPCSGGGALFVNDNHIKPVLPLTTGRIGITQLQGAKHSKIK